MKKMWIVFCVFSLFACTEKNKSISNEDDPFDFEWIIGEWSNIQDSIKSFETWEKVNDSLLTGHSYTILYDDTVFKEDLVIEREGKEVLYIPTIPGVINDQTTVFKMISNVEGENYTFENKDHDFPQKIVYKPINKDSMIAFIEGEENGAYRKEVFPFRRVKDFETNTK